MARRSPRSRAILAGWAGVALGAACSDGDRDAARPTTAGATLSGDLTVFAAASLTDAFSALGAAFEAEHDDVTITFNFAASPSLREQILDGAPADVFASADQPNLDQVISAGAANGSDVFAVNRLAIAVPEGNPAAIRGLADFADPDLLLGLCAAEVPCGRFARQAFARAGVEASIDTNAPDVRALLTQVASGDLDAAVVYVTDVRSAARDVDGITIPIDQNVRADYPIAALTDSGNPAAARAFVDFVSSPPGRAILGRFGFEHP